MKKILSTITIVSCAMMVQAQSLPMDEFVTQLMGKMTLEEKLGQLNLLPGGDITTGASSDIKKATKVARRMVTRYGMSDNIGVISYDTDDDEVFIGRDLAHTKSFSEEITAQIEARRAKE